MKYSTILFDLDGTLLNTLEDLTNSVNFALRSLGYPERTLEEVRGFVGNGMKKLVERALPPNAQEPARTKCFDLFSGYYGEHLHDCTVPYAGIPELLHTLKENGCRIAIVSNKMDGPVRELAGIYFPDCVDAAIGTPADHKKPDPYCVYEAARSLGAPLKECIYVGDSGVDVETARNAGILCIGVTWGFAGKQALEECGPDFIAESTGGVLSLLQ
ncbi:MAG: HAD-IA family hydrolase [Lachnospiraceae bacterium]|nr:HAD-IA family hydrolase [Lachnospiraceae bacterium]